MGNEQQSLNGIENSLYHVKRKLNLYWDKIAVNERWFDNKRKCLITCKDRKEGYTIRYLVHFKRDFFNSVGSITGQGGFGESINIDIFDHARYELDCYDFLYVYEDGRIYHINATTIKANGYEWINKADNKPQLLFPIKLLTKVERHEQ